MAEQDVNVLHAQQAGPAPNMANVLQLERFVFSMVPKYRPGLMPWTVYKSNLLQFSMYAACQQAPAFMLKQAVRQYGLDPSVQYRLRGTLHPAAGDEETFVEYIDRLGEAFEGRLYTEEWRNQFVARRQAEKEPVVNYVETKFLLYCNAQPEGQRDMNYFYSETLQGLLNADVRERMHNWLTDKAEIDGNVPDIDTFNRYLLRQANSQKAKLKLGLRSPTDALYGTTTPTPYQMIPENHEENLARVESGHDRVHFTQSAPTRKPNNYRAPSADTRNFQPDPHQASSKQLCFWCLEPGHFKSSCPKRANGIPRAVNALAPDYEVHATYHRPAQQDANPTRPYYGRSNQPPQKKFQNFSRPVQNRYGVRPSNHGQRRQPFRVRYSPRDSVHQIDGQERAIEEFFTVNDDGNVTIPAAIAEALTGLTLEDPDSDSNEPEGTEEHEFQDSNTPNNHEPSVNALTEDTPEYLLNEPYLVDEHFLGF